MTICLPLGTVLIIFGMKYFSAMQQAKARFNQDEAYRQIATRMAEAQAETAAALSAINGTLTDINTRLAAVEKILKDVE
ncbi:hypothetical protein FNU76_02865 [Chitinimonas arctica]|uniref:Uncharacterized protein n=1 Tax=Chitinimonas arctica TaxID=2594795 RepID=A0A516SB56_9NEIS|nr:hypothetical protein [Chitinimonas arctica]QDQ25380.1 hypothetical protein FNU76_02865 [Chitinimonas arctica]